MQLKHQAALMQTMYGYGKNCQSHKDRTASGYCAFCGAPVCDECKNKKYCEFCLAEPPKKKSTALLLALFLGFLGAHRFYMGFYVTGVFYLLTLGLFGVGWLIDVIRILCFSTVSVKERDSNSFGEDLMGTILDTSSSNVGWFLERRFWRDKYGRPLLPLGRSSLD